MVKHTTTSDQTNFELFLEVMEKRYFHDGGKRHIHDTNNGFLTGTESRVDQTLERHEVGKADKYLREQSRNKHLAQPDFPMEQSAPKSWITGLSLFARKEKKPEPAPTLSAHRDKKRF